ncbi:hypothetical protein ALTERO38_60303 [Alteromonas sp. 38]|nr:hypothetical protein ALTER154_40490 [Alteromonas sp. 154]VXC17033.1 hypothetical protein ALTERO38_60303 [Alteromonas sp. 38]
MLDRSVLDHSNIVRSKYFTAISKDYEHFIIPYIALSFSLTLTCCNYSQKILRKGSALSLLHSMVNASD